MGKVYDISEVTKIQDSGEMSALIAMITNSRSEKTGKLNRDYAQLVLALKCLRHPVGDHFIPTKITMDFTIACDSSGQKTIYQIDQNDELEVKQYEWLSTRVTYAMDTIHKTNDFRLIHDFTLSDKQIDSVTKLILKRFEYLKQREIPEYLFSSEAGITFRKLDFDPEEIPTPTFDGFMARVKTEKQRSALLAFIGAIFDRDKTPQQYAWLVGEGDDGKGSLFRLLQKMFSSRGSVSFSTEPASLDKHWAAQFVGKRFGFCAECEHPEIISNGMFKSITGGDPLPVRAMRKESTTVLIKTLLMLGSNKRPTIKWERALRRRALYIEFEEKKAAWIENYEDLLWQERAGIVAKCIAAWNVYRSTGRIPADEEALDDLAIDNSADYFHIAADKLRFGPALQIKTLDFWRYLDEYIPGISAGKNANVLQRDFVGFLRKNYNVERCRKRIDGYPAYVLSGVSHK